MRQELIEKSYRRILTLHPQLQASAFKCYDACLAKDIPLYVVWARRSKQEQELLYRIGRDTPGKIVTYTRSDYSPHCYGLCIDFCLYSGDVFYEWPQCENSKYWRWKWIKVQKVFEQDGWESGWRWTNFQPGYLQNLLGKTIIEHKDDADKQTNQDRDYWRSNL